MHLVCNFIILMDKKLKSPEKLFEDRELQFLEELEYQKKVQEDNKIKKELSRRLIVPKIFFGDDTLESKEIVVSEIKEEENIQDIQEEVEIQNVKEEIEYEEEKIDVELFLINLSEDVNSLKKNIENTKKYNKEIKFKKIC